MQEPYTTNSNSNYRTDHKKEIDWVQPVANDAGEVGCYVINFKDDQGYVILSGDYRTVPVFAHADKGSFPAPGDSLHVSLAMVLEQALDHVDYTRDSIPEVTPEILSLWMSMGLDGSIPPPSQCDCSNPTYECEQTCNTGGSSGGTTGGGITGGDGGGVLGRPYTEYAYSSRGIDPKYFMLETAWEQRECFNDHSKDLGCTGYEDTRAWAGCVAIAMAQVMRYYKYPPDTYNWDAMPIDKNDTSANCDEAARLIRYCGDAVNMHWGCNESRAQLSNVSRSLSELSYYNGGNVKSFDRSEVWDEIFSTHPVILGGCRDSFSIGNWNIWGTHGHAWVCDGYKKVFDSNGNLVSSELHMNWGWGPKQLNWTYDFITKDGTRNYQYGQQMITGIRVIR